MVFGASENKVQIGVNAMLYLIFFLPRGEEVMLLLLLKKAMLSEYLVYVKQTLLKLHRCVTDPKISAVSGLYSSILNAKKIQVNKLLPIFSI